MKTFVLYMLIASVMGEEASVVETGYNVDSTTKDPTIDLTFTGENLLKDCKIWWDGCRTCTVKDGRIGRCTREKCTIKTEAFCTTKEITDENLE